MESRPLCVESNTFMTTPNAASAGTVSIGKDLVVNRLGFGAMRLTGPGIWGDPQDPAECKRVLKISRLSVRKVLRANSAEVPKLLRPEKAEPYRQQILELLDSCKGNLVRVQEELAAS